MAQPTFVRRFVVLKHPLKRIVLRFWLMREYLGFIKTMLFKMRENSNKFVNGTQMTILLK